ncbi:MAG: Sec-independent protein translocase protein TatB [Alphaproteobacteria bacterium]|nr:Sec-independent protein translocase protein TatB [Alphaproteobacteria bacterium]
MFDLGWQEFFLIAVIGLLVVGPKDLPGVIRTVVKWIRKVRGMARDFQHQVEEVAREAELDEIREEARKLSRSDIASTIRDTVDPDGELTRSVDETRRTIEREARSDDAAPAVPAADTSGAGSAETGTGPGVPDDRAEEEAGAEPVARVGDTVEEAGSDPGSRGEAEPAAPEPAPAVDEPDDREVAAAAGERR